MMLFGIAEAPILVILFNIELCCVGLLLWSGQGILLETFNSEFENARSVWLLSGVGEIVRVWLLFQKRDIVIMSFCIVMRFSENREQSLCG